MPPTLPSSDDRSRAASMAVLRDRLRQVEQAESPDEAMMDALAEAEGRLLEALACTRAANLTELGTKLAVLAGRARDAEGLLTEAELGLLWSALRDVRRMDGGTSLAVG